MHDIKVLATSEINSMGIYYHIDEVDMRKIKCMIIGVEGTPYEFGYYFFDLHITPDYPFEPMTAKYQTRKSGIRFNPNLYCCGKVCLSILNTWAGPQWTSCQSPMSVMVSLQSLLNNDPLCNEPGYETCSNNKKIDYNNIIKHENYAFSIYNVVKNGINGFECFANEIKEQYIKNNDKIMFNLQKLIAKHNNVSEFQSTAYFMCVKNNYTSIYDKMMKLNTTIIFPHANLTHLTQLKMDYKNHVMPNTNKTVDSETNMNEHTTQAVDISTSTISNKNKTNDRKAPNGKASQYKIGHKHISENNGELYEICLNKSNAHYWKKYANKKTHDE